MRRYIYKTGKLFILSIAAFAFIFSLTTATRAQGKGCQKPVTLPRLKVNLENKSFNTQQIVQTIKECGADFQLTPQTEAQLVAAGARPQVLEAIRNNYRAVVVTNPNPNPSANSKTYAGAAIQKAKLIAVIKNKNLGNGAMVEAIGKNGVDFRVTPAVEKELAAAGASPAIISAAKTNYRSASSANGVNNAGGSPMTREAIVALLKNGTADAQVQTSVKNRGVNFKLNPQTTQEIKIAGGSPALIKLLDLAYIAGNGSSSGNNSENVVSNLKAAVTYDDLVEQAIETYNADVNSKLPVGSPGRLKGIEILKNAIQLDAANPAAYQQLGYMTLYGTNGNFAQAEQYMARAVALGGNAVFKVFHDHNGAFTKSCQGSLYVAKDGVRFESDDNVHTFNTSDTNIQKVDMNSGFKRAFQSKAGSFKIVLKSEDKDGEKYSFAPLTNSSEESKMVIRLIGKN